MRTVRWSVAVALLIGCGGHRVRLPTPQPTYEFKYRVAQFRQMAPAKSSLLIGKQCVGFGCHLKHSGSTLILPDGQRITDPRDLLAVVDPASDTARHAREVGRARRRQAQWGIAGLGISLSSFAVAYISRADDTRMREGWAWGRLGGYTLGIAALVTSLGVAWYYEQHASKSVVRAFESYPYDLANTLRICFTGFTMHPCDGDASHPDAIELRVDDR